MECITKPGSKESIICTTVYCKSFEVEKFRGWTGITNSLENFRGLLTPVNLKETRSHIRTLFNTTKYRRTVLDRFRTRLCRLLTGLYKGNLSPSVSVAGGLCHTKSRNMQCGTRYSTRHTKRY